MMNNTLPARSLGERAADSIIQNGTGLTELQRSQHLALALDSLGQPLIVLCCRSEILHASPQAMNILADNDGLLAAESRLRASLDNDDAKLQTALGALFRGSGNTGKPELLVHRPSGKTPYKIRITPFRMPELAATQAINGALLLIHDAHANHTAWQNRLRERFKLTPRECECAVMLADGCNLPEIAERMSISTQTLRQHIKHAMQKTGTHKQHELAGIVMQMHRKR